MKEGNRVGGMRAENEVLVRILQDDTVDINSGIQRLECHD
jgi:hypothetical protein